MINDDDDDASLSEGTASPGEAIGVLEIAAPVSAGIKHFRRRSRIADEEGQQESLDVAIVEQALSPDAYTTNYKRSSLVFVGDEEAQSPKEIRPLWQRFTSLGSSLYT